MFILLLTWLFSVRAFASTYDYPSSSPYSEFIILSESGLTTPFCAEWNPDFPFRGGHCCAKVPRGGTNRSEFCPAARARGNFCNEMTQEQKKYTEKYKQNSKEDVLELIKKEMVSRHSHQAFCTPNNGFLAWGRPLIPSAINRIQIRSPDRCTHFGTDLMVGMLEWLGRQVGYQFKEGVYDGGKLLVGDISAPRGGCLKGRGGKRGHSSHMTGLDVDIGFLAIKGEKRSPSAFHKIFDVKQNWWLTKNIFKNPFVCVKAVFLDRSLIRKLKNEAKDDPDWSAIGPYIKHVKYHKNHMHIRIGQTMGAPGCVHEGQSEVDEDEDELEENDPS